MKVNAKNLTFYGFGLTAIGIAGYLLKKSVQHPSLEVAKNIDLLKYTGQWYEIARLPNTLEKNYFNARVSYSINTDGSLNVLNSCRTKKGRTKMIEGKAYVVDTATNAKLKVRFVWPFTEDYNILDVGENYEYSLVGSKSRKNLLILSRTEELDLNIINKLTKKAEGLGFDTSKLLFRGIQTRIP